MVFLIEGRRLDECLVYVYSGRTTSVVRSYAQEEMMDIKIEDLKRIDLKPGEILVVRLPGDTSRAMADAARRQFDKAIPTNIVMVYVGDEPIQFEAISPKEGE